MYAQVIVDINNVEVDKVFEYSFSDCKISLGSRVVVPFGSKFIEGIVIGIKEQSDFDPKKIKPIASLLEQTPALTENTLKLMEYVCKTCYVTRASALRLFLPSEMRKGKVKEQFIRVVELLEEVDVESAINSLSKTAKKQKECLAYLNENGKSKFTDLANLFGAGAVNAIVQKGFAKIEQEKFWRSPYKTLDASFQQRTLTPKQEDAVKSIENTARRLQC
jgi:primosomal protein N' (replication factor Y)